MYIKQRLKITSLLAIGTIAVVFPIIIWSMLEQAAANRTMEIVAAMERVIAEKIFFRDELLLLPESAGDQQRGWVKNRLFTDLIQQIEATFGDNPPPADFKYLKEDSDAIQKLTDKYLAIRGQSQSAELEPRLIAQLLLKTNILSIHTQKLASYYLKQAQVAQNRLVDAFTVSVLILTGLILVNTLQMNNLLNRNIAPLHTTAAQIFAGDLTARAAVVGHNELSDVTKAFNQTVGKLQAFHEADLEKVNQELRAANTELSEFTNMASHDLQAPLRNIIGLSHMLEEDLGPTTSPPVEEDIHLIIDATAKMQTLVKDLLAFSKSGRSELHLFVFNLQDCIDYAMEVWADQIKQKPVQIIVDQMPNVMGDRTLLNQVFQNLIGNALIYSATEQPIIHLTYELIPGQHVVGVRDNGIGINPQYFDQIFLPFKRLHSQTTYAGNGIGLAICKKIVERHNGRIWVESDLGRGAWFKFTLPTDLKL